MISRDQPIQLHQYWSDREWRADFQFAGPLEHAATGVLLPAFKVMKPVPEDFRFLMVRHHDELWRKVPL